MRERDPFFAVMFQLTLLVVLLGAVIIVFDYFFPKRKIDGYRIECVEGYEYYSASKILTIRRTADGKFVKCEKGE